MQRRRDRTAWVLKSPVHLHALPTLFGVYPDARVAVTHRDPITLLASLTSLIANLRWAHSNVVDPTQIARAHVERYESTFEQLVDWTESGALPADRMHHSHFTDFQRDALGVVARLYDQFGIAREADAEASMGKALDRNPADRHGKHDYARNLLDAPPDELRARFARYQACFDVGSES